MEHIQKFYYFTFPTVHSRERLQKKRELLQSLITLQEDMNIASCSTFEKTPLHFKEEEYKDLRAAVSTSATKRRMTQIQKIYWFVSVDLCIWRIFLGVRARLSPIAERNHSQLTGAICFHNGCTNYSMG